MALVPISAQPVFVAGYPLDGCKLYAYDASTTALRSLFLTSDLDPTRVHPTPVQLVDGQWPIMFVGPGAYDLKLFGPDEGAIRTFSALPGEPAAASSGTASGLTTGDYVSSHRTGNRTGFVRANGGTIGSSSSAGTERANDDTHALFVFLWTQDQTAQQLTVLGGRSSAGAEADWQANKTISLPNLQNRFAIGLGDQGNAGSQASITGGLAPNGTVLGALGGAAVHTLTTAEIGIAADGAAGSAKNTVAGTATAHNTLPPFAAVSWYLKL